MYRSNGDKGMCLILDNLKLEKSDKSENTDDQGEQETIEYGDLSRRDIRALIFHLLYAAESFDYEESLEAIVDNFNRGFNLSIGPDSEVFTITQGVIDTRNELDIIYQPYLTNWRFDRISVSTKLILRLAVWELTYTDTDVRIVINEAVELAKCFAEEDSYRFINGVLDRVVKEGDDAVTT